MTEVKVDKLPRKAPEMGRGLTALGIGGTGIWLLIILAFSWSLRARFSDLGPNEIGDFLAGFFAPLAFFWLVLGFFQQGAELRNSGNALWLQGEELRNSVEQQRQLVEVSREALKFEADRLARENDRARSLAQPKLELTEGGWSGSAEGRDQQFSLSNHGRTCTRVELFVGDRLDPLRYGQLESGDGKVFTLVISPNWPGVQIRVDYLDAHAEPGSQMFEIHYKDGELSFS